MKQNRYFRNGVHYITLKYMTARPLYARCKELDADNSYEGNDLEKKVSLEVEAVPKNRERWS